MLRSKKFIYDCYKDSVLYIAEDEQVTIDVAIDMMIANMSKIDNLIASELYWYSEPITHRLECDYNYYLELVKEERK